MFKTNSVPIFDFQWHNLSAADQSLLKAIEMYSQVAQRMGFHLPASSPAAFEQLQKIPEIKKAQMAKLLSSSAEFVDPDAGDDLFYIETKLLERTLREYGLEADESLLATIDKDTVVEIYSTDMTQLFRSYKLLEMTGYSLLDLCVYEWYVLWERPQLVVQQMQKNIQEVIEGRISAKDFEVSPHILKETFNPGNLDPFIPRSCEVRFQKIGLLHRLRPDSPEAFLCTAKGSVIAKGQDETRHLAFL